MDRIIADKKMEEIKTKSKESLQINFEEYNRLLDILVMKNNLVRRLTNNLTIAEDRLRN